MERYTFYKIAPMGLERGFGNLATTKAQQKATAKYMKANYDEFKVRIPKGEKAIIEEHAKGQGKSLNGFVKEAIAEKIKRDEGKE